MPLDPRHSPLDYAPPGDETPAPRRSFGTWIILLLVWAVGLVIWAFYIAILFLIFLRIAAYL